MTRPRQTITVVPVERLTAHPGNIRTGLGPLDDLARSIREHGILQPLTATEHPSDDDCLVLLAGHRRLAAAQLAGETKVPVIIRHALTDQAEHTVVMLVENTQRRDLTPIERAEALDSLRHQGMTVGEIARRTGISVSSVSTSLALLDADESTQKLVASGQITAGDALIEVRERRQEQRVAAGGARMGRKASAHFSEAHPLAAQVRRTCTHPDRTTVGKCGCGPCWETAIRDDATRKATA